MAGLSRSPRSDDMNLNHIATKVALMEGGKVNLPIAQVKEVMRCYNKVLANDHKPSEILKMLERYKGK